MDYAFTYWEGRQYAFTQVCIESITRFFGSNHIHLTLNNLHHYVDIDSSVRDCDHVPYRSDYIRTMLLEKYGGWWFDCDVLLTKSPLSSIKEHKPHIWNLIYCVNGEWVPLINNGILYTPRNSTWISKISKDFREVNCKDLVMTYDNEDIGQNIYEKHSVGNPEIVVGCEYDFNSTFNVNAEYEPFWNGEIQLDSGNYGIHIGASLSRWAAQDGDLKASEILSIESLETLVERFPQSVVSQYVVELARENYGDTDK
jgi:hypothetical protein